MAKAVTDDQRKYRRWDKTIAAYDKEFKPWCSRVEKILQRYRDDRASGQVKTSKFNILWSNVQTLVPATFSRLPQPDVSRRFRDNDPVGRVASLILERALDFEIQHYPDYRETLKQSVHDRFLGGRGTCWARYEPHIQAVKQKLPEDGEQVTEDVDADATTEEQLEYECAPVDYVHWKDFGHSIARTWEEVTKVWRVVYMTREACVERFGEKLGNKIPLDSTPDDYKKDDVAESSDYARAKIYEGWDKQSKEAVWISKSLGEIIDTKPDPLGLEGFFPCPKPLFATLTNESLIPTPDFTLYQDQARSLDTLAERISGLIIALQVKGCYDASVVELGRLFTEGMNTNLIPVKNWAAFSEKNGLQGAISLVDLDPIASALKEAYAAMEQVKQQVYEITGISDIVRGQTEASETATAQQIKGQYASLRLRSYQNEVAEYATSCLRLKAQIMCAKFDPQTMAKIACVEQFSEEDQKLVPQAMQLLMGERAVNPEAPDTNEDNPLRSFRIEIAADTLVQMDEEAEKTSRVELATAIGKFFQSAGPIVQSAPTLAPFIGELLKFVMASFKAGKTIEGVLDEAMDKAKQDAMTPKPPPPDPKMEAVKAKAAADAASLQQENAHEQQRMAGEERMARIEASIRQQELAAEDSREQRKQEAEAAREQMQMMIDSALERWKVEKQEETKIEVAEISAAAVESAEQRAAAKE